MGKAGIGTSGVPWAYRNVHTVYAVCQCPTSGFAVHCHASNVAGLNQAPSTSTTKAKVLAS
jgi:hypothetical protein